MATRKSGKGEEEFMSYSRVHRPALLSFGPMLTCDVCGSTLSLVGMCSQHQWVMANPQAKIHINEVYSDIDSLCTSGVLVAILDSDITQRRTP